MRFSMLVAAALTISSIAVAGELPRRGEKRVWEIDDAERIARRFDAGATAIRRLKAIAAGRTDVRDDYDIVVGSENPELMFPFELFNYVELVFDPNNDIQYEKSERILARAESLGFGKNFLDRLEIIARPFIDANLENRRLQLKMRAMAENDPTLSKLADEMRRVNKLICPTRTTGIATARRKLGRELFERFLYEAIAPDAVVMHGPVSDSTGDMLLWVEEGCR